MPASDRGSERRRRRLFSLALVCVVVAGVEALGWIGLRLLPDARMRLAAEEGAAAADGGGEELSGFRSVHPFLGYVLDPRASEHEAWGRQHPLPLTEYGFVGDGPLVQRRAPGRVIVGITGGSVAFHFSLRAAEELTTALKESPAYREQEIAVVRFALPGYKQPQQLMALQYLLALGAEFDVVINLDGFNEVALYPVENAPRHVFLAYPRAWPELTAQTQDASGTLARAKAVLYGRLAARWRQALDWEPLAWSRAVAFLREAGARALAGLERRATLEVVSRRDGELGYSATGPLRRYPTDDEMYRELAALWARSSLQMERVCRSNGARYFHFLQPNQYAAPGKPMDADERAVAIDPSMPYAGSASAGYPYLQRAGKALAEANVRFTDLTELFRATREGVYADACCHLNERGNRLVGHAIAREIVEAGDGVEEAQRIQRMGSAASGS